MLRSIFLASAVLAAGWAFAATKPGPPPPEEKQPPPEQPIAFSHKAHSALGIKCRDCHAIADPGYQAGYPKAATCMACHASMKADSPEVRKLARLAEAGKPIEWVKVYSVPAYVYFSHQWHVEEAGIDCAVCHGPVAERDVLFKEKETNMAACMSCHDQHNAPNDCDLCHDPA